MCSFCSSYSTNTTPNYNKVSFQVIRSTSNRSLLYVPASTTETLQFSHFNFFSMLSWILSMFIFLVRVPDWKSPSSSRITKTVLLRCATFSFSNAFAYGISSSYWNGRFSPKVCAPSRQEIVIATLCATSLSKLSLPSVSTDVGEVATFVLSIAILQPFSASLPRQSFTSSNIKKSSVSQMKSTPFAPDSLLNRFR